MAGIEDAFEKFVKKISDIEEKNTEDNSNVEFGKNVYAPQDGLFFNPVQKNQIPFGDLLKSDQRLNPPVPTPMQRNLTPEERMRSEDNEYFMGQGQPQYVSPVVQGQGFNKRDLKDFTKQYFQNQTPLGGGIGYQGPQYGVVAIKPFVGPDRSALLQGYYNTDNEGSRIQAGLSPKEQRIDYTGNTGTTFSAGRNTFQGSPYYTLNLSKSFADGGIASMFRERPSYAFGGMMKQAVSQIGDQLAEKLPPEQQEAIVKANQSGGGIGSIFRNIISRVSDVLGKVVKKQSTATPAAGLAIPLDRPVQSGDPIGSYYANPNNPALSSIAPPTTNPLTRPLSTAGFYGSEIFDILKRLGFNFADGGRVSMSEGGLTTTVPPAKGPDSQGVESLFRRRYS